MTFTTGLAPELLRQLSAAGLVLAYAGLCAAIGGRRWARARAAARQAGALATAADGSPPVLVLHGSQTGLAERLAAQTAQALHAAGLGVRLLPANAATAGVLRQAQRVLLLLSTYGEGDAPDNAASLLDVLDQVPALAQLHYGVLALGDRTFQQYCGFGRVVDAALAACGAVPLFPRIEMDRGDGAALQQWQDALGTVAGTTVLAEWTAPDWEQWTFAGRRLLNPGSTGGPVCLVRLLPPAGAAPMWESGDIAEVCPPENGEAEDGRPRDYSIASVPADGGLEFIVRRSQRADGSPGRVSGWLTDAVQGLREGDPVRLRLRVNRNFRLGDNAGRPLVLVGNGTGIAGLRGHLRARAQAGQAPAWLVFGERQAAFDTLLPEEMAGWLSQGTLARVDLVFSRDGAAREYVQQRLLAAGDELCAWVARGAAVYVCGSLAGMAPGVDAALREVMGGEAVDALAAEGRYRRDVY